MSTEQQIARRCKDCPTWTKIVCRHVFGVYWCIKSDDGEGCAKPLDGVAEAWRKVGWKNGMSTAVPITLPIKKAQKTSNEKKSIQGSLFDLPPLSDNDY